jgi:hypothetical protein
MLKVTHNAGFFSCCNVRLREIINYFNENQEQPKTVDSSSQFILYKPRYLLYNDITHVFFVNDETTNIYYKKNINISSETSEDQFSNYKLLNIEDIKPFIGKYFSPSQEIIEIQKKLISKYKINTNNCIAIYYRGTDKYKETILGEFSKYDEMINKIKETVAYKNSSLLVQSDSRQFLNYMKQKHNSVIIIKENKTSIANQGIHLEKDNIGNQNYVDIKILFASFLILSKCKYLICSSSNCSLWMMYYRGNTENVYQYLINDFL